MSDQDQMSDYLTPPHNAWDRPKTLYRQDGDDEPKVLARKVLAELWKGSIFGAQVLGAQKTVDRVARVIADELPSLCERHEGNGAAQE